ncbi:unnamed protein product, partial [Sphacelaria rigidula]
DLSDPKPVNSHGGKWYTMIARNDYSRFTDLYFLRTKHDAELYFTQYIAEISARTVEMVTGVNSRRVHLVNCVTRKRSSGKRRLTAHPSSTALQN